MIAIVNKVWPLTASFVNKVASHYHFVAVCCVRGKCVLGNRIGKSGVGLACEHLSKEFLSHPQQQMETEVGEKLEGGRLIEKKKSNLPSAMGYFEEHIFDIALMHGSM